MVSSIYTPLIVLNDASLIGALRRVGTRTPLENGTWYATDDIDAGLSFAIPPGTLHEGQYLTADMLADGTNAIRFLLTLYESKRGAAFQFGFALLNQCAARFVMPLTATDQNRWLFDREGAFLKPYCSGDRVDPAQVDRITLTVHRKSDEQAKWCMTPFTLTTTRPEKLTNPALPRGILLDEIGQNTLRAWSGKSSSIGEVDARIQGQLAAASTQEAPPTFNRWGGSNQYNFDATGYFRTHHDGQRWWLVDPDGGAFWSTGFDCVTPIVESNIIGLDTALQWLPPTHGKYAAAYNHIEREGSVSFLTTNLIRALGTDWYEGWSAITLGYLRHTGFNTIGNWSDWKMAHKHGFPYVRTLDTWALQTPPIFRDFPDVYAPEFDGDAAAFGVQLADTKDDPALLGYFLMNEPNWGFASFSAAAGMLLNSGESYTRRALADYLRNRYSDAEALAAAWECRITFDDVATGVWRHTLNMGAETDLRAFSAIMVDRLFRMLSEACRAVDPHHLNLGARYYTVPPDWALHGMRHFDVFSMNCYDNTVNRVCATISEKLNLPILIGEYHFGALDVGLPASGIGHVLDQAARGQAYRVYVEDAAAQPWCVGAHYFTLYDQSALGRFDGENYSIGFIDTCNRPYEGITEAARLAHERLYDVAAGSAKPYDERPVYLPNLF